MSTNIEPFVNRIVTDSTTKNFINNVDLNLIDPFKISDSEEKRIINNKQNKVNNTILESKR
jgi:hypothetical protein